jgi:hypothetical protein
MRRRELVLSTRGTGFQESGESQHHKTLTSPASFFRLFFFPPFSGAPDKSNYTHFYTQAQESRTSCATKSHVFLVKIIYSFSKCSIGTTTIIQRGYQPQTRSRCRRVPNLQPSEANHVRQRPNLCSQEEKSTYHLPLGTPRTVVKRTMQNLACCGSN